MVQAVAAYTALVGCAVLVLGGFTWLGVGVWQERKLLCAAMAEPLTAEMQQASQRLAVRAAGALGAFVTASLFLSALPG